jgi:hypothetical protein
MDFNQFNAKRFILLHFCLSHILTDLNIYIKTTANERETTLKGEILNYFGFFAKEENLQSYG